MGPPRLSATDRLLIRLLQQDARRSNKELARLAGIAKSTCLERVRNLRERGVITGWHAHTDLDALGRPIRALISVRLQPKTTASVNDFVESVLAAAETVAIDTVSGEDDFLVRVAVPGVEWLRTFVLEHITSRSDVADTRTSLVYDHQAKDVIEEMETLPRPHPPLQG